MPPSRACCQHLTRGSLKNCPDRAKRLLSNWTKPICAHYPPDPTSWRNGGTRASILTITSNWINTITACLLTWCAKGWSCGSRAACSKCSVAAIVWASARRAGPRWPTHARSRSARLWFGTAVSAQGGAGCRVWPLHSLASAAVNVFADTTPSFLSRRALSTVLT
jgi:hypothetical protein